MGWQERRILCDSTGEEWMEGLDVLQAVQFVTVKGKRLAVISAEDWEALIEWLETTEDIKIAGKAAAELEAADGDRQRAGWLRWEDVEADLE
jgi:PHD/YefM family antitoxin component YafN of YafNO toxin-antitoxin module